MAEGGEGGACAAGRWRPVEGEGLRLTDEEEEMGESPRRLSALPPGTSGAAWEE